MAKMRELDQIYREMVDRKLSRREGKFKGEVDRAGLIGMDDQRMRQYQEEIMSEGIESIKEEVMDQLMSGQIKKSVIDQQAISIKSQILSLEHELMTEKELLKITETTLSMSEEALAN